MVLGGPPTGGPLLPGVEPKTHRLEIRVDAERYPELADHAVEGPPVVPVVMVTEWMLSALAGVLPGCRNLALEDLRVRRGLAVEGWPASGLDLAVTATPSSEGYILALVDDEGTVRYSARGRALASMPQGSDAPAGLVAATEPRPYGGVLFHGPRFQALDPLEAIGDAGARGRLSDAPTLGWTPAERRSDPVKLDGALQLAVLVTDQLIQGASLPTRIRRIAVDLNAASGVSPAWSVTKERSTDQVVHDVVVQDGRGAVAAILEGVETTRRPNWRR